MSRTQTSVRIPDDLLARIDEECERRVVGRNFLLTRFIREGLDRLPPLAGPEDREP